jgi:hypothetical protein
MAEFLFLRLRMLDGLELEVSEVASFWKMLGSAAGFDDEPLEWDPRLLPARAGFARVFLRWF